MNAPPKRESLNLRVRPEDRGLIDRAADALGKTRTDFILDAARAAAETALLDRTVWALSPEVFDEVRARFDAPPRPNDRLRRMLRTPPPWDEP